MKVLGQYDCCTLQLWQLQWPVANIAAISWTIVAGVDSDVPSSWPWD